MIDTSFLFSVSFTDSLDVPHAVSVIKIQQELDEQINEKEWTGWVGYWLVVIILILAACG